MMDVDAFRKEIIGTFEPMDHRLWDLGVEYHRRCEIYDRTVCTGPIVDGSIMPMNHQQLGLINRQAGRIHREIMERGQRMGFTREDIHRAIVRAADQEITLVDSLAV